MQEFWCVCGEREREREVERSRYHISDRTRAHSKMAPVPSAACSWRASNHFTRTPSWSRKLQQSSRTRLARSSLSPTLGSQAKPTLSNRINVWSACKATARRTSTKSERKSKTIKVSAVTESAGNFELQTDKESNRVLEIE